MEKVVTAKQMQRLDKIAIERYGIPSVVLMENAGSRVTEVIDYLLGKKGNRNICVVCGVGNNAGDGFVVARQLSQLGFQVDVFLIGHQGQLKPDARINYQILKKLGMTVKERSRIDQGLRDSVSSARVVVDAIFGVGLSREVQEPYLSVIASINRHAKRVVSVDVPSGLNATSGEIHGNCVNADLTVTFTFPKQGFFIHDGPQCVGKIVVVDIGIPKQILRSVMRSS